MAGWAEAAVSLIGEMREENRARFDQLFARLEGLDRRLAKLEAEQVSFLQTLIARRFSL